MLLHLQVYIQLIQEDCLQIIVEFFQWVTVQKSNWNSLFLGAMVFTLGPLIRYLWTLVNMEIEQVQSPWPKKHIYYVLQFNPVRSVLCAPSLLVIHIDSHTTSMKLREQFLIYGLYSSPQLGYHLIRRNGQHGAQSDTF